MSNLRYGVAAIALAFAGLSGHATAANYSLAHSKSEGVEVFVDHADGQPWCGASLELRFAFSATPPAGAVERLMPKIGSLLNGQCPQAAQANWYSVNAAGVRVAQGSAGKVDGWVPEQAAVDLSAPSIAAPAPVAQARAAPAMAPSGSASSGMLPNVDIVGVRLGMSEAEVKAILEADYKVKLEDLGRRGGNVSGIQKISIPLLAEENLTRVIVVRNPEGRERISVGFSLYPQAAVISVEREITFPDEGAPTFSTVVDALMQKYGKPTAERGDNYKNFWWFFDASADLLPTVPARLKGQYGNCSYGGAGGDLWEYLSPTAQRRLPDAARFSGAAVVCGNYVAAEVRSSSSNKQLAYNMRVSMHAPLLSQEAFEKSREIVVRAYAENQRKAVEEAQAKAPPKL